jgi:branched-chain amino acid transport system substrate-binding protein
MFFALIRLIGGAALLLQLGGALASDPIKIAYINSMSGTFAFQGEEQLKVFNAAADMINAQGGVLGGRKFEIVTFDDKANPQEALVILKQVTDQDIRYVASTISSVAHALSDAVAKYNERNPDRPILFVNFNALDPALTQEKCNFWHFRFEAHTDMQLNALLDSMAKERSIQKVYLLNQDYAYGQAFAKSAREMLAAKRPDVQIVGDDLIPLGKVKDFAPYVAKIRASGADTVLTGNWGNDLSLLIKASNEASLKATYYTLLAAFFGTPAAIGASGADRVKSTYSWSINAADEAWEKRVLQYEARYKSVSDMAYLPPFRVLGMLADAMNKVGTTDALKVAYALEGMRYKGPTGDSWMRVEDHQMMVPVYVLTFAKAGQPGVKHDAEGTGYGWKTDGLIDAKSNVPPVRCQMQRPPM